MENQTIYIDGEIFLNTEELKECKKKNYINKKEEICGKESLKPNLRENITVSVPPENNYYYYYFKLSEKMVTRIKVKKEFPREKNGMTESEKIQIRTQKLRIIAEVIGFYYYHMTKYFQEQIASLDIEKLYAEYSEEGLRKIERIIQEITLFYAKIYYKYPLLEERKSSKELLEIMEKFNIDEQLAELEKVGSLIREIVSYQLKIKQEKEKEIEDERREKWNKIFAAIGIVLTILQIIQGFFL